MSLNPYESPQTIDCARRPPARSNPNDAPWLAIYLLTSVAGAVVGESLRPWIDNGVGGDPVQFYVAYFTPLTCGLIGLASGVAIRITCAIRAARTETIASPESDD